MLRGRQTFAARQAGPGAEAGQARGRGL